MSGAQQCRGISRADWRRGIPKNTPCRRRVADESGYCMEHREQLSPPVSLPIGEDHRDTI